MTASGRPAAGEGGAPPGQEVVIFHHVPKTAGTSLRRVLEANYRRGELLTTYWGGAGRHELPPLDAADYRRWYWALDSGQRERMRCVAAHNANCLIRVLDRPFRAFSLLRNPIDRVISLYNFRLWQMGRERTPPWGREIGHEMTTRGWSLADLYLNLGGAGPDTSPLHGLFGEFFNGQARSILKAWDRDGDLRYWGGEPDASLEIRQRVMGALARHYVVGVQERFLESLQLFAASFGWRNVFAPMKNVRSPSSVDPDTRALIAAHNQLDLHVHAHYEAMLERDEPREAPPRRRGPRRRGAAAPSGSRGADAGPIAVLGAPGSGASLTAGALELLGIDLGGEHQLTAPAPGNGAGAWQHRRLTGVNERLLAAVATAGVDGEAWRDPPTLRPGWECAPSLASLRAAARHVVAESFGDSDAWAWKDPRSSLTLPFWQLLLGPTRHVICVRHPLAVADCLQRRTGMQRDRALGLWSRYNAAAVVNTAAQPRIVVAHEGWARSPRLQLERLADFLKAESAVRWPRAVAAVEAEIHQHSEHEGSAGEDGSLPGDVKALHEALMRVATDDGKADPAQLDRLAGRVYARAASGA